MTAMAIQRPQNGILILNNVLHGVKHLITKFLPQVLFRHLRLSKLAIPEVGHQVLTPRIV